VLGSLAVEQLYKPRRLDPGLLDEVEAPPVALQEVDGEMERLHLPGAVLEGDGLRVAEGEGRLVREALLAVHAEHDDDLVRLLDDFSEVLGDEA
jgi:hypothetical protein